MLEGRRIRTLLRVVIFGRLDWRRLGVVGRFIAMPPLPISQCLPPTDLAFPFVNATLILYNVRLEVQ